jgi:hypothetical protein
VQCAARVRQHLQNAAARFHRNNKEDRPHGLTERICRSYTLASSLELSDYLASMDALASADFDGGNFAGGGSGNVGLHFHGFEDEEDVANLDGLPRLDHDAHNYAGDGAAAYLGITDGTGRRGRGSRYSDAGRIGDVSPRQRWRGFRLYGLDFNLVGLAVDVDS